MRFYQTFLLASVVARSIVSSSTAVAQPSPDRGNTPVVRLREDSTAYTAYSGIEDSLRTVIRDAAEWKALWTRINRPFIPAPTLPSIDFRREMIVVAALGRRPSAGYDVVIEEVDQSQTGIDVGVRKMRPAPGCPVSAVVTRPLDVARIPASDRPVRFHERTIVVPCDENSLTQAGSAKPEDTIRRLHVVPALGLRFGTPQKASAALGVVVGQDWQKNGRDHSQNVALFAEPGISAGRASLAYVYHGFGAFGSGIGVAATGLRTWDDPWTVKQNQTYVGGEVILWPIVFIGPRVGLFRNVSSTETSRRWFVSFDFGIGL